MSGKQTLGENIGDLTGVVVAHAAYQLYPKDHPDEKKKPQFFHTRSKILFVFRTSKQKPLYSGSIPAKCRKGLSCTCPIPCKWCCKKY